MRFPTIRTSLRHIIVVAASLITLPVMMAVVPAATAGTFDAPRQSCPTRPAPGAAGIGDPLFPTLGNGGYDVNRYRLDLSYQPTPKQVGGVTTVQARATASLSRFNLDFAGDEVDSVAVDGRPAAFVRSGADIVITPDRPVCAGNRFSATVSHRSTIKPYSPDQRGWIDTPDGAMMAAQPNFAHTVFPSNDHPLDKAHYEFHLTAPAGTTAVASGVAVGQHAHGGAVTFDFAARDPMAAEVVQVAFGALTVRSRPGPDGVTIRDAFPAADAARLAAAAAWTDDHLRFFTQRLGPYPFETYGILVINQQFEDALETQTLSLLPEFAFDYEPKLYQEGMVHELAHQWFGDSVSPCTWSDVWLNEGHAVYYENLYADRQGWRSQLDAHRQRYAGFDRARAQYGPVGRPKGGGLDELFNSNVYGGGALVLFALHEEVGEAMFQAIERAWVTEKRNKSGCTKDFADIASRVADRDLHKFLNDWLYGTITPAMPRHPDWRTDG
jgi:aminopeptidase N